MKPDHGNTKVTFRPESGPCLANMLQFPQPMTNHVATRVVGHLGSFVLQGPVVCVERVNGKNTTEGMIADVQMVAG